MCMYVPPQMVRQLIEEVIMKTIKSTAAASGRSYPSSDRQKGTKMEIEKEMGLVRIASWYPNINGRHFGFATQRDPQNDWTATQNRVNYDVFAQTPLCVRLLDVKILPETSERNYILQSTNQRLFR